MKDKHLNINTPALDKDALVGAINTPQQTEVVPPCKSYLTDKNINLEFVYRLPNQLGWKKFSDEEPILEKPVLLKARGKIGIGALFVKVESDSIIENYYFYISYGGLPVYYYPIFPCEWMYVDALKVLDK